jgi:DNA invertase Pin-like site-specific DNA recombinase
MLIGYARVSTEDQNLDLQRDALRAAGCEKIYEDRISGAKAERPGLALALEVARAGDALVVWRLDRLGRSLHDLILLARKLEEAGVGLMSVQERIGTSSGGGRLIFHMFGAPAEFERNLVRERTRAGLTAARARGRKGGRPKLLDPAKRQLAVRLYAEKRHTIGEIRRMMGISKPPTTTSPRPTADMRRRRPSDETLAALRARLEDLPLRSTERGSLIRGCADLHGISVATVYRALRDQFRPRALHRRDRGCPRKLPRREMERFCEPIAAMKLRTTNLKGRHLSTGRALELLVEHGIETPDGLVRAPPGLLTRTTVDRYLRAWGIDQPRLERPPPAARFEAPRSNECWQFDLSPSDLKQVPAPLWVEAGRGPPTLMLFSVVDDRSGLAYQE